MMTRTRSLSSLWKTLEQTLLFHHDFPKQIRALSSVSSSSVSSGWRCPSAFVVPDEKKEWNQWLECILSQKAYFLKNKERPSVDYLKYVIVVIMMTLSWHVPGPCHHNVPYKNKTTRRFKHCEEAWRVLVGAKVVLFIESIKLFDGKLFFERPILLLFWKFGIKWMGHEGYAILQSVIFFIYFLLFLSSYWKWW